MNIPDEAVQEAINAWFEETREHIKAVEPLPEQARRMRLALTAAAPYMSGVKVDDQGIYDFVQGYEWRGDSGDYTPNDVDREMLEDAIVGYLSTLEQSSAREQVLEEPIGYINYWNADGTLEFGTDPVTDDLAALGWKSEPIYKIDGIHRAGTSAIRALKSQPSQTGGSNHGE